MKNSLIKNAVFLGALFSSQGCGDMGANELDKTDAGQNEGLTDLSTNPDEISETQELAITRCEFFIKLLPYLLPNLNDFTIPEKATFQDLKKEDECYIPLETAYASGIYSGTATGLSGKDLFLNRAEAVKTIVQALNLPIQSCENFSFKDIDGNHWAYPYVSSLTKEGLLCGIDSEKSGQSFGDCFMADGFVPFQNASPEFVDTILENVENPKTSEAICE